MSETLPPHQNEPQTWRRELPLHHETADKLKPEETLALVGSFTESSLEGLRQDNETGEISDRDYSMRQLIHAAALEQLSTLKVDEVTNALNAIVDRRAELETVLSRPSGGTRSRTETQKLREQLEGVKLLNKMYLSVDDTLDTFAQTQPGDGDKHDPRTRAAAINEMIARHNEQVSGSSETIADSPEVREAQERINARFTAQANRPQPAQSVDDARQKVSEALGDAAETEKQTLLGEVAKAAVGSTRIHTDVGEHLTLKSSSGDHNPIGGFNSFGDGLLPNGSGFNYSHVMKDDDSIEAFLFEPDTTTSYKTVQKTVETGGLFRKKTEQVEEQVPDGEVPTMVTNPATGRQEPGVRVSYQYDMASNAPEKTLSAVNGVMPQYLTMSGRPGNKLFVEATLPKSVADRLRQAGASNPEIAREFAKTLVLNNGMPEQVWDDVVRPPYDRVPDDWEMTIVDLQKDTEFKDVRHKVVSRRKVKAGN